MEQKKKELLMEQANKIEEVVKVLTTNFDDADISGEINYLNIVKSNLEDWVVKS